MLCCPNKVAQWENEKLQRGWTLEMNAPGSKVLIREGSRERPRSVSYVLHYGKLAAAKVFQFLFLPSHKVKKKFHHLQQQCLPIYQIPLYTYTTRQ
jgi:hypothetical protein